MLPPSFLRRTFMNIDHITDITIHFNDSEWILEHITIGLQSCSDDDMILSILVDTFSSRISLTMPPSPKPHNTACVLS